MTRVEMKSLEGAIKSYKADYERFPIGSNRPPHPYLDYTGGEVKGTSWKMKNSDMMYILLAEDGGGNAKHARNPKKKNTFPQKSQALHRMCKVFQGFLGVRYTAVLLVTNL